MKDARMGFGQRFEALACESRLFDNMERLRKKVGDEQARKLVEQWRRQREELLAESNHDG